MIGRISHGKTLGPAVDVIDLPPHRSRSATPPNGSPIACGPGFHPGRMAANDPQAEIRPIGDSTSAQRQCVSDRLARPLDGRLVGLQLVCQTASPA